VQVNRDRRLIFLRALFSPDEERLPDEPRAGVLSGDEAQAAHGQLSPDGQQAAELLSAWQPYSRSSGLPRYSR